MPPVENTLTAGLLAVAHQYPTEAARSVYEFAETRVMAVAKERTPVDYGTLKASGLVEPPVIAPGNISVTLGFGGGAAHYAIYVHEDLDAHHEVGQAKFLESAMNEAAADFIDEVSSNIARALGIT